MQFEIAKVCCFWIRLHLRKLARLIVLSLLEQLGMSRILARLVNPLLFLTAQVSYHCQLVELVWKMILKVRDCPRSWQSWRRRRGHVQCSWVEQLVVVLSLRLLKDAAIEVVVMLQTGGGSESS